MTRPSSFDGSDWFRLSSSMNAKCHVLADDGKHTLCGLFVVVNGARKGAECCKRCIAIMQREDNEVPE